MKKINFFLPFYKGISGGYKVVYQYANYLSKKGYDVYIYYDLKEGKNKKHIPKKLMISLRKFWLINYPFYYTLDKKIVQKSVSKINDKTIREADVNIATTPSNVHKVYNLNNKSKKIYFIQGYDIGGITEKELFDTYKIDMQIVVISKWLKEKVEKYSVHEPIIIKNGISLEKFKVNKKIEDRKKHSVAMIYRGGENKACNYGIEAIKKLKEEYSDIELNICGDELEKQYRYDWINSKVNANEEEVIELLNNNSIFLCTSIYEGFGLPGLEAMACGCALVTTDCFGPREYANDDNAIFCKPQNVDELVKAIKKYFDDDELRNNHISKGLKTAKEWDVNNSYKKFIELIEG